MAFGIGATSEISGRSIREMIGGIFMTDEEIQYIIVRPPPPLELSDGAQAAAAAVAGHFPSNAEHGPGVCNVCFNLLEQIEAFEMNLNR